MLCWTTAVDDGDTIPTRVPVHRQRHVSMPVWGGSAPSVPFCGVDGDMANFKEVPDITKCGV